MIFVQTQKLHVSGIVRTYSLNQSRHELAVWLEVWSGLIYTILLSRLALIQLSSLGHGYESVVLPLAAAVGLL